MAVLDIRLHPDKILLERAPLFVPGKDDIDEFKKLLRDMIHTVEDHYGLGLAAPQVGVSKKIVIYRDDKDLLINLVNPAIIARNGKITSYNEGCLSCPGFTADIKRSRNIVVSALTFINDKFETVRLKTRRKFEAIKLQHEIDHVNGITIIERSRR